MTPEKPKVSVSIVTYNHEKYISQALDGALMQETNFDYEILVGEDDSSDGTREIVKGYAERHPDRIRLFLNDRKNVIYIDGRPTGRWNFLNNLRQARGEYIALLDGDDYWTSPHKLQKQVDVLENNKNLSICFHSVKHIIGGEILTVQRPPVIKKSYTVDDLLAYDNFIAACSVVYRAGKYDCLPKWIEQTDYADWVLYMINVQYGQIGYIDEVMSNYRIHVSSLWNSQSVSQQLERSIKTRKFVVNKLGLANRKSFRKGQSELYFKLAKESLRNGEKKKARSHALEGYLLFPFDSQLRSGGKLLKIVLISFWPNSWKRTR